MYIQRRHTLETERASLLTTPSPSVSLRPRLSMELPTTQVNSPVVVGRQPPSHALATRWRDSMASLWVKATTIDVSPEI